MTYADEGEGRPIILVHGWAAHGGFFQDLRKRLSRSHRVLTPTLRGHPGSAPGAAPLAVETLAQDIARFVHTLRLEDATALGWSMGAMALWSAAPDLEGRVERFIVEDMGPRLTNGEDWSFGLAGGYAKDDVAATLNEISADWPAYVARFAPHMFAPAAKTEKPHLIAWAAAEMSSADPVAMASLWASMAEQDCRAAIARIEQPMLVIHGGESQTYPDGATAFVADTAPRGQRVVIPGAGHVPHLEAPDLFLNHIEAFVRTERRTELQSGGAVP